MKFLQRVVWSEGMFMSPHHLQQQDAYHEALLNTRLSGFGSNNWGVVSSEVDAEALSAGQLQFHQFFGIMPDGLPLQFERGDLEAPPVRPIEEQLGKDRRSLEIFLGVPKEREGFESYAGPESRDGAARFRLATRPVPDLLSASSVVPVVFAQRNVRILFGSEPRDDFECLKVAEIKRDHLGALKLDESFIPPCLRIGASPFLLDALRKILQLMLAKHRELADTRRHRDASSLEFTASDVTRYLQLHALNSAIPTINHLAETGESHPHVAYLILMQLAGELSTFTAEADLMTLPKFQFTQLSATFGELFNRLNLYLRSVAIEQCIQVPLEIRPGGIQVGNLEDERLAHCTQFILSVKSELSEQMVADQLPRLSKIASLNDLSRIVQAAAPGVPLQATFRPPPEVPVRPGVVYFSLAIQDGYWKNAMRDRAVALFLPQPFDPSRTKIELLGVPGATH